MKPRARPAIAFISAPSLPPRVRHYPFILFPDSTSIKRILRTNNYTSLPSFRAQHFRKVSRCIKIGRSVLSLLSLPFSLFLSLPRLLLFFCCLSFFAEKAKARFEDSRPTHVIIKLNSYLGSGERDSYRDMTSRLLYANTYVLPLLSLSAPSRHE